MKSMHPHGSRSMKSFRSMLVALFFVVGCSRGYHTDYCGCVPYDYCPPNPLPYKTCNGCETPLARQFRHTLIASPDRHATDRGPAEYAPFEATLPPSSIAE